MFTGAGYQYVGLGRKVYDNMWGMRQYFDRVEKKLPDFKINKIAFLGPLEELIKQENGTVVNAAYQAGIFDVLKEKKIIPEQIAGFRNGELIALSSAEAVQFEEALAFLVRKNELTAAELGKTEFSQLLINGTAVEKTEQVIQQINRSVRAGITSYNSANSSIIIFESKIKNSIMEVFKKMGSVIVDLPNEELSNFFLLENVAKKLSVEFNEAVKIDKPVYKMLCQTKGDYYDNTAEIRSRLFDYVFKPARLDGMIGTMLKNTVNTFVEIGCGTFMGRMVRKADPGKRVLNTHDLAGIGVTIKLAN
jgi:[acyl-carrier-protein] S-malonyltransferase